MSLRITLGKKLSADFNLSDLLEIQKNSYKSLFFSEKTKAEYEGQTNVYENLERIDTTDSLLDKTLRKLFPISDSFGRVSIEYISSRFGRPKYTVSEAITRSLSYTVPFFVKYRMIIFDIDLETGVSEISSIKEQEIHLCDIPLMAENTASFVLNGVERVVVSQIHRSPGVFFESDEARSLNSYTARIIPHKGSWIDFEFNNNGILFTRINRKRKFSVAAFLSACGFGLEEVVNDFTSTAKLKSAKNGLFEVNFEASATAANKKFSFQFDVLNEKGEVIFKSGSIIKPKSDQKLYLDPKSMEGSWLASNINLEQGSDLTIGSRLSFQTLEILQNENISFSIVNTAVSGDLMFIFDKTFMQFFESKEESIRLILKSLSLNTPSGVPELEAVFERLFFNSTYFDLSEVGRYKINSLLGLKLPLTQTAITKEDIKAIVLYLLNARKENKKFNDLDSLANRRIRSVGELFKNHFESAFIKAIGLSSDKLNSSSIKSLLPSDIISVNTIISDIKEFFLLSRLSQFTEQTNPLSDLVHKRRITALGVGGLSRDRAGFEVRDVHYSHYSRICPIETPEGANIGLINTLACYAKINNYGFITAPYRKVENRKITNKIEYFSAEVEKDLVVAQIDKDIVDDDNNIIKDFISCRHNGDFIIKPAEEVEYIEVSPKQILSISASLVPFVESDDAARALMGANMQRQAVPLVKSMAPVVGTGLERDIVTSTDVSIKAKREGKVTKISNDIIFVEVQDAKKPYDIYHLKKFAKTNHGTSFNHITRVSVGDVVKKDQILADGPSTDDGEIALGKDLLVAFMPWNGYNFEDAIIISEKVVNDGYYTSIHIEELETVIRDTRLGSEEITRDLPNVSEEMLKKLDESGIVQIGSYVRTDDILVGKITPKIQDVQTPEEKLLGAIFGERNGSFKNTSLFAPPGISGTVIDVKMFVRPGVKKNERLKEIELTEMTKQTGIRQEQEAILERVTSSEIQKIVLKSAVKKQGKVVGIDEKDFASLSFKDVLKLIPADAENLEKMETLKESFNFQMKEIKDDYERSIGNIVNGGDIPQGALAVVKVYIATERRLQPGDKMAGRHGNKGVVSIVLPEEEMPFMADGTPVEIVLNPLGASSRMNIGQIMETHLGLLAKTLGKKLNQMLSEGKKRADIQAYLEMVIGTNMIKDSLNQIKKLSDEEFKEVILTWKTGVLFANPSFEGIDQSEIGKMLERVGHDHSGQFDLYDGKTGEKFERKVTAGYMHVMKLHHLVEDKVHARSVGSYSIVTQQPLGGKAYFGGQRLGEMECWALQAYGVAYTLQEMLTVKSDDINGRTAIYESIIKGTQNFICGIPESFNVMIKELRSLCLDVELESL
jgi:DNA-directed RNA polymerase subunit beta